MNHPAKLRRLPAFTLIELLIVMAVIGILLVISVPALSSLSRNGGVTSAGNTVVDLVNQARENSMARGSETALAYITGGGGTNTSWPYGAVALFESTNGSGWSQSTPWSQFPDGIHLDSAHMTTPTATMSGTRSGNAVTIALQAFLPNGSMAGVTNSVSFFLDPGVGTSNSQPTNNWYQVLINPYTGSAKIIRPNP